jgi:hypothetical protein
VIVISPLNIKLFLRLCLRVLRGRKRKVKEGKERVGIEKGGK